MIVPMNAMEIVNDDSIEVENALILKMPSGRMGSADLRST